MASALDQSLLPVTITNGSQSIDAPLSTEPYEIDSTTLPATTNPTPAPVAPYLTTAQQPTPLPASTPPPSPLAVTPHDKGYVPRGFHRKFIDGTWTTLPDEQGAPPDIYGDAGTFPEHSATVQIVTFFMGDNAGQDTGIQAKWESPLNSPPEVRKALKLLPQESRTWRWIHCEGLHGPTMRIIAEETNWSLDKFAGIFSWPRASAEWTDGCLLVHFQDQITHIWMLYGERPTNPVFITCTKLKPHAQLKKRWEGYIDFGDSRRELLLRKDPSLMLYCMMRAIIQDLRATAFTTPKDLIELYDIAMAQPSNESLSHFYNLQQRLIQVTLSATSLKYATATLIKCVKCMHEDAKERGTNPLVSQSTYDRLEDQMGLVELFCDELPEATRELDAVASLAFNILAYSTNNLLRVLAVLTIASVPLALACAILSIDFPGREITSEKIVIILCSLGAAVILGVSVFLAVGPIKLRRLRGVHNPTPIGERIAQHRTEVQRAFSQTNKRDTLDPDHHLSPQAKPAIPRGASPPPIALQPRLPKPPRLPTVTFSGWARQPGSPPPPV